MTKATKLKQKFPTREAWLEEAVKVMDKTILKPLGFSMPELWRVTIGFPSVKGTSLLKYRAGECWDKSASHDKHVEIIINMRLDDPLKVLDVLIHEMGHGVVGCKCGHKGPFTKFIRAVGLEGKATSTNAGPELKKQLIDVCTKLGAYPHARLNVMKRMEKKQTTRLIKCECDECGYVARTTRKWIEEKGPPICPCNAEVMSVFEMEDA